MHTRRHQNLGPLRGLITELPDQHGICSGSTKGKELRTSVGSPVSPEDCENEKDGAEGSAEHNAWHTRRY